MTIHDSTILLGLERQLARTFATSGVLTWDELLFNTNQHGTLLAKVGFIVRWVFSQLRVIRCPATLSMVERIATHEIRP
jgi:hypothetical protein